VIDFVEKIINSKVLCYNLTFIPKKRPSEQSINRIKESVEISINPIHEIFIRRWNGIDLEVIKIYSFDKKEENIPNLMDRQFDLNKEGLLVFGSSPSGFLYSYDNQGIVFSIDTDGWNIEKVADSFEDFICNYVFGKRSREFGGDEWYEDLKKAGIFND
jgi:hypothetical protein